MISMVHQKLNTLPFIMGEGTRDDKSWGSPLSLTEVKISKRVLSVRHFTWRNSLKKSLKIHLCEVTNNQKTTLNDLTSSEGSFSKSKKPFILIPDNRTFVVISLPLHYPLYLKRTSQIIGQNRSWLPYHS